LRRRLRPTRSARGRRPAPSLAPADVDALYGLEPVFDPAAPGDSAGLGEFVDVDCPYCGERYVTPIDLTAGASTFIEDCQICCRPIELEVRVTDAGALDSLAIRRLD
jgi:cysteine-rich CPXCG protein